MKKLRRYLKGKKGTLETSILNRLKKAGHLKIIKMKNKNMNITKKKRRKVIKGHHKIKT